MSTNVNFNSDESEIIHLSGAWARERHIIKNKIVNGSQSVESRRGASGHGENPFRTLVRNDTTEIMEMYMDLILYIVRIFILDIS